MKLKNLFLSAVFIYIPLNAQIRVKIFTGNNIKQLEQFILEQRQISFSQFPYLMDNDFEFEKRYISYYSQVPTAAIAVAFVDGELAGFLTGMGLKDFDALWDDLVCERISDNLEDKIDINTNYYFPNVIVVEKYRGKRIVDQLFRALERYAQLLHFETTSLITVIRENDDPLKPAHYVSPTKVWNRIGYEKSGRTIRYNWLTHQGDGTFKDQENVCDIWIKSLSFLDESK